MVAGGVGSGGRSDEYLETYQAGGGDGVGGGFRGGGGDVAGGVGGGDGGAGYLTPMEVSAMEVRGRC